MKTLHCSASQLLRPYTASMKKRNQSRNGTDIRRREIMGVKVREKEKDSGIWWVFINHNSKRSSRQVGTKKAADKVKEHIEARLKLGQWLPEEKPPVQTVKEYYDRVFLPVYLESAVAESTAPSYMRNFTTHI